MDSSGYLDIICHRPFRLPRQSNRRVLILPDGNHRASTNREGYASGADNVVACAEYFAGRSDVSTLVMCVASDHNTLKRDEWFFQAVAAQFSKLRTSIVTQGVFLRSNIRCHVRGNVEKLRSMGGARACLADEVNAVCAQTTMITRPRLELQFWLAYADDIAWQTDVDAVIRTGAEEADVVRPGISLPPGVPFGISTTLWPHAKPTEIGRLLDTMQQPQAPRFAAGYDVEFVELLLRSFCQSRIAAPIRLTIATCATHDDIITMLERVYGDAREQPPVAAGYIAACGAPVREYGPRDDAWYTVRIVAASSWGEFALHSYDAIIAPGQRAGCIELAMHSGFGHVHTCATRPDDVLRAVHSAVHFPAKHVLLCGADRSNIAQLTHNTPWPADLLDLMRRAKYEQFKVNIIPGPIASNTDHDRDMLIKSISARVLAQAMDDRILLPDEHVRQSDRNYAYTGAYMMLQVPDELSPTGAQWQKSAEIAIRCMLTISAGDNGVFDRVLPGETTAEWRDRLETSARYFDAIARDGDLADLGTIRCRTLVESIGKQWRAMLDAHSAQHAALITACRDALQRHYMANIRERSPDVIDNPLVHRLNIGGIPRRDASNEIEKRYMRIAPEFMRQRIRALLDTDVTNPVCAIQVQREMKLLLHLIDTAHSIAVEVLFLFSALPIPAVTVTTTRLQTLIEMSQVADYTFRLANDLASLDDALGGERDPTKESSLSVLIPSGSSASSRQNALERARELGNAVLLWLESQLGRAIEQLRIKWPSMAEKVIRAVRVGRAVYAQGHYTTLTSDQMLSLIERIDHTSHRGLVAPRQTVPLDAAGQQESTFTNKSLHATANHAYNRAE